MGALYLVATPIGNLEDISQRALRVLGEARLIACEDTRQTRKLLARYAIATHLVSYHEHNKLARLEAILAELEQGDVALVSDAGTPGLNDPGYELVRAALQRGYQVSPIPGACAPIAALVVSGLPTDAFLYLGYLPRKSSERRQRLEEVASLAHTLVLLEAPHRLLATLEDLLAVLGNRQTAIARELTKAHEEIFRGELLEAQAHFLAQPPRGEFTLVIAGDTAAPEAWNREQVEQRASELLAGGAPPATVASQVASQSGWPRREVYRLVSRLKPPGGGKD
ncbi:MAG: 16S rRNA (cytidine(1402)-2'-O)-methyltransferase [Anaerolineales bacterium]|nr:16S rRNA (cytidine(1402)-2'-O)-methyltransferase [Anaerolineales bacterium]